MYGIVLGATLGKQKMLMVSYIASVLFITTH